MSGLPEGVANGPSRSEYLRKDAQTWERPWTLEEMRQNSANWSLAADSGRVYDEEVEETIPKTDALEKQLEQEKTREQKEVELIPKMQEAVNHGLRVLESAFERLDIKAGNSDSEDEEVTDRGEAILEPKDLYVDRPLPYLIGSQAFMEQEDVGLGDLSSDEMSVDSDRDSVIESEDGKDAVKSSMLSYEDDDDDDNDEEEDEDSDIFGESDGDDDDSTKNTGPSSFADELAARIKGEPVKKAEGDRASAEEDSDDMFKPPKMDDDDFSPFGGKSGLFSGGRGLFDDDEGDLFSEAPKPPVSEEKKVLNESTKSTSQTADNSLFSSGIGSDSVESKENGTPAPKASAASKPAPTGAAFGEGGGGLFDDEDEDDDFFRGTSLIKSDSAGDKKPKKAIDLFDEEDDDDGDIFSEKFSAPAQSQKEVVEEQIKQPEKKMPAGAMSMFGPGTQSLLNEGLKKSPLSPSKESEKPGKNGPAPDAAVKQTQKPQTRGLFSDDEDTPGSPAIPRSQSKPELTSREKANKPLLSLFDDEEEEDLFASAKSKAKPNHAKASTPQLSTAVSSSLFSDDEDQWVSSVSSAGKPEVKTGGMKPSASAPSSLTSGPSSLTSGPSSFTSAKMSHKSSLFDNDDEDDLFAPTTQSSQKKSQRVALLFEDEGDDEDKGSVSGIKPAFNTSIAAPAAQTPAAASQSSSPLEESEEVIVSRTTAQDQPSGKEEEPAAGTPEPPSAPSSGISQSKKKPAGAVSLFGGIDILANKRTKSPLAEVDNDDSFLSKDSPPPNVKREEKVKINTVSLFDDEEEDESDWNEPIFTPSKPPARDTLKPTEERPAATSTGVFQDEELLFSQTQQKDNDPDVDLFATSDKAASSKLSEAKPATQSLFAEEDEDELFSSVEPKAPRPKVAEKPGKPLDRAPLASPESVSEIQANLMIDPTALLPGATPIMSGAVSGLPGMAPSSNSSLGPSPATTPTGAQGGVNFDSPAQVTTLQSAHKSRAKGFVQRRPQSRAARQQAAHRSVKDKEETKGGDAPGPNPNPSGSALPPPEKSSQAHASPMLANSAGPADLPASSPSQSSLSEASPRPPVLNTGKKDTSKDSSSAKALPSSDNDDLFGSDGLFGASSVTNTPSARQTAKPTQPQASSGAAVKKDTDKSTLPSIFNANPSDLFQKVKPRSTTKKAKATHFMEEDEDDEDIFGVSNSSTQASTNSKEIKNSSSFSKQDIFQGEVSTVPKVHKKNKEKTLDASLFDDNIDIFADLTDTLKPKQKSKTKGETKSIFADDMDDIFSPSTVKPVTKAPQKSKKTPRSQETSTEADSSNIFDDPLNALGGN
ncbi:WASH complex subunit FAM21 [Liparis tanakae]|uniref:WASH complex subunit FAM21 n=1 Tax=Liparis tanakae TaxID=230148 RepID=A0A4Z2IB12_9TELE|nr:WASH complex subunit FAM21 [Liparis tanakae]